MDTTRCLHCNLALCFPCYSHYTGIDEKYQIKVNRKPWGSFDVICYNCRENERVMYKIDCWWFAVHGTNK